MRLRLRFALRLPRYGWFTDGRTFPTIPQVSSCVLNLMSQFEWPDLLSVVAGSWNLNLTNYSAAEAHTRHSTPGT